MSTLTIPRLTPEIEPRYQVTDELQEHLRSLIPEEPPKPKGERPRMDDRQALNAIFYLLCTGCHTESAWDITGQARRIQYNFLLAVEHFS